MSRLYIHIGTHKTGTTSIQHALRRNKSSLRKKGLIFLPIPTNAKALKCAQSLDSDIIQHCRYELNQRINQESKKDDYNYIMSWEGFSGDPSIGYSNAKIIAESLKNITAGYDAQIIVYLRRQDDYVESMYTQKIHEGLSLTFDEYLKQFDRSHFNWQDLLNNYSKYFGKENIVVRRYHRTFLPEKDSIFMDFCKIINIDSSIYAFNEKKTSMIKNAGYSRDALEIARATNQYLNETQKKQLRSILQQTNCKQPFEKYRFFSDKERIDFLSQYADSNSYVAKEFCNEPSGNLFPSPSLIDKENNNYTGLTPESVAVVLVKVILLNQSQHEKKIIKIKRFLITSLSKYPRIKNIVRLIKNKIHL